MVHAAIAATIIETLQAVNSVSGTKIFSFEFVAKQSRAVSKSGIRFNADPEASKKIDVLIYWPAQKLRPRKRSSCWIEKRNMFCR
jgi:hypothetical protein